ncbi:hypothetical protein A3L04_07255 [Thermococcus chitonophagus]|uniref:DUF447 family protein n=1 Tax=Thermococcus chitonophagus TaxID=54262 RepID=A0A160VTE0_9EURY|nr:DUF447 domain-containing protein [Thermococcus chitonophagus]ASJ16884.1 hypothetical protein A3L04_07255 [Thermococcus chitonophagus]CUX78365.1 hypothetical protein CHITON_1586 [Thermococcus chitonophagus]
MIREFFPVEGKTYEVLLITSSNLTPIGVVRESNILEFTIFEGKSYHDLLRNSEAVIQVVDDVELLVSLAFNVFPRLKFGKCKEVSLRKIEGYSWIEGYAQCKRTIISDFLGSSRALKCRLQPVAVGVTKTVPRAISRADNALLELGVFASRLLVARRRGIKADDLEEKVNYLYKMYKKLGGKSKIAEVIYNLSRRESCEG